MAMFVYRRVPPQRNSRKIHHEWVDAFPTENGCDFRLAASFPWKNPWIFNLKGKKRKPWILLVGAPLVGYIFMGTGSGTAAVLLVLNQVHVASVRMFFWFLFALVFWRRGLKGGKVMCDSRNYKINYKLIARPWKMMLGKWLSLWSDPFEKGIC